MLDHNLPKHSHFRFSNQTLKASIDLNTNVHHGQLHHASLHHRSRKLRMCRMLMMLIGTIYDIVNKVEGNVANMPIIYIGWKVTLSLGHFIGHCVLGILEHTFVHIHNQSMGFNRPLVYAYMAARHPKLIVRNKLDFLCTHLKTRGTYARCNVRRGESVGKRVVLWLA